MSQKPTATTASAGAPELLAPPPPATLPDLIRCSVCERPLMRARRDGLARAIMIKCRHCGALQHRRL
jgi:hypothetical protein